MTKKGGKDVTNANSDDKEMGNINNANTITESTFNFNEQDLN